jgi:hypothetical protein
MTANPDTIIKHVPGQKCHGCSEIHPEESFQLVGKRQVIDTPVIKAKVTEHQLYKSTCKCGYVDSGTFPVNVSVSFWNLVYVSLIKIQNSESSFIIIQ